MKSCFDLNKTNDGYYKVCLYKGEEEGSDNEAIFSFFKKESFEITYPTPAFYSDTELIKIKDNKVYVRSTFSDNGLVDLNFIYSVKGEKIFLDKIFSYSTINISPYGAVEICKVEINRIYDNKISYYVNNFLFDLNEKDRRKACVTKYNKS